MARETDQPREADELDGGETDQPREADVQLDQIMDWQAYWGRKRAEEGVPSPRQSVHRARKSWNDYSGRGIYHITIVTYNRKRVFGELNGNLLDPKVTLTKLGLFVQEQWEMIPTIQAAYGRKVSVLGHQVMPDHFHGVLRVEEPLPAGMGEIVRAFKAACTGEYRGIYQPRLADDLRSEEVRAALPKMSHKQREEFYQSIGAEPLFETTTMILSATARGSWRTSFTMCKITHGVPADTAYSRFHNLNDIARMLCGDEVPQMTIKR